MSQHSQLRASLALSFLLATWLQALAAPNAKQAARTDIIVASAPSATSKASDGSDIRIYTADGKLRNTIHLDFYSSGHSRLGVSGNAEYAFFGPDGNVDSKGEIAVARIAGGPPKYLGAFDVARVINSTFDNNNVIASGDSSSRSATSGSIFVSKYVLGPKCKNSDDGSAVAISIAELRFSASKGGKPAKLTLGRSFDAYRPGVCFQNSDVLQAMRTIGNNLYVVIDESKGYTLRSFDLTGPKPKRSPPIVTYSASTLTGVTIDSPTSFTATGLKPGVEPNAFARDVLIKIVKGKKPLFGGHAPGPRGKFSPSLYSGGLSSYTDGKGIIAATGALNAAYGPVSNTIYKFNPNTLRVVRKLFTLPNAAFGEDLLVIT